MIFLKKYIFNVLIAIDQLFNAILFGDPDETMSSRFGKWKTSNIKWKRNIAFYICKFLHFIDDNHCKNSIENDEGRKDLLNESPKNH